MANAYVKTVCSVVLALFIAFGNVKPVISQRIPGPMQPVPDLGDRDRRGTDRRVRRQQDRILGEAAEDVASKLKAVLEVVNSGDRLGAQDIEVLNENLQEYGRYARKFDEAQQCNYHLLNAWMSYYVGDHEKALKEAAAAYKADPENKDARATQIALAILNRNYKGIAAAGAQRRMQRTIFNNKTRRGEPTSRRHRRGARRGSGRGRSGSILDLNIDSIRTDLLGTEMPPLQLNCLNGSSFSYRPTGSNTLCILFWRLDSDSSRRRTGLSKLTPAGPPKMFSPAPTRRSKRAGRSFSEDEAFADLFRTEFDNPKILFAGINLDNIEDKRTVMEKLLQSTWHWAQIMATDAANEELAQFVELDIDRPALAIVAGDGLICYAGAVSGFLPRMVLAQALSVGESEPKEATDHGPKANNTTAIPAPKRRIPSENPKRRPNEIEEEPNPHAEELYQMALIHKRKGYAIGYKKAVDYCRRIIQLYPDSSYAQKARMLLRGLPERKRRLYNVTDEEMGL